MNKKTKRFVTRWIGFISFRLFAFISAKLPLTVSYFIGRIIGKLFNLPVTRYRKVALESLAIAFPQKSINERRQIAKESIVMVIQGGLELLYFYRNTQRLTDVRIEGREYLDAALKSNKGVVGVTAHFGNFPLMLLKLAKEGYSVNTLLRPMRDPKAGDYVYNLCKGAGIGTIFSYPRREVVNGTISALRDNEIVLIQMDQNFGTGGVWVDFFGRLAATPVGPIVFASRTEATILPIYIVREGVGKHCIKILPPQPLEKTDNRDETILLSAIKITKIIESWIKAHPSQWAWIHRRWKSRPSEKVKDIRFKVQKI
ncbi:MAG: lysophospholipid acyltransferase family protein [Candidatus Omnitrophica bacterium]|nr:lysophospholipid acyltransferase family protein [Candidatus Omnitrophota bacterium]